METGKIKMYYNKKHLLYRTIKNMGSETNKAKILITITSLIIFSYQCNKCIRKFISDESVTNIEEVMTSEYPLPKICIESGKGSPCAKIKVSFKLSRISRTIFKILGLIKVSWGPIIRNQQNCVGLI